MKPLYALPDHEVIKDLIPGIADTHLSNAAAIQRIRDVKGLVPVGIDPQTDRSGEGKVLWADLGEHPFREWQFSYTVQHLSENKLIGEAFSTDFSILQDDAILVDSIRPKGFIFHVGRCGSTLMAKALARSPQNVVVNEGGPLQKGFWQVLSGNWSTEIDASPEKLRAFRNLVMAMTRRRLPFQDVAFVKLISWNALYIDFIKSAFPEAAALFLYRDPVEVIASVRRGTTSVLLAKGEPHAGFLTGHPWEETAAMGSTHYIATCIANYMQTALALSGPVQFVNYVDITPENFPVILDKGLAYVPMAQELQLMLQQFLFHAKDDTDSAVFVSDIAEKQSAVSAADKAVINSMCRGLLSALDQSPGNIFAAVRR